MTREGALGEGISPVLIWVFAIATGAMVANIYYSQSIIALIAPDIGFAPGAAGWITTVTQLGYGAGLLFLVSLADLVENRRLVLLMIAGSIAGLLCVAIASWRPLFLLGCFLAGVCSTGAQVLVPFAAHLARPETRGRVIGAVMSGLLTGIMLCRPLSSALAALLGWRAIFLLSALVMLGIGALLARMMPRQTPAAGLSYGAMLRSMARLVIATPILRRRAAYQALMFAAFNLFWTAAPLMLMRRFHLDQYGVALFALAGAGGALAAPVAGHLADRGHARAATGLAVAALGVSFLLSLWAADHSLPLMVLLAIAIDAAVQVSQISGQRLIFALPGEARGRINASYMTLVFLVGALGSTLGAFLFAQGGWRAAAMAGVALGVLLLLLFATELCVSSSAGPPDGRSRPPWRADE